MMASESKTASSVSFAPLSSTFVHETARYFPAHCSFTEYLSPGRPASREKTLFESGDVDARALVSPSGSACGYSPGIPVSTRPSIIQTNVSHSYDADGPNVEVPDQALFMPGWRILLSLLSMRNW